jgi:hypothetical protein
MTDNTIPPPDPRLDENVLKITKRKAKAPNGECESAAELPEGVRLEDFVAYMPGHGYIFMPARDMWAGASINARIPPIGKISASAWLDRNSPVEQMTWHPGLPELIRDRLVAEGGWIGRRGVTVLNLYRPPALIHGDPGKAGPWLAHGEKIYPNDFAHFRDWSAHRVQFPGVKLNHAFVLGGDPGIGKDTLLEPVKQAIGHWNFQEASPAQILGRFNSFIKAVILRISEARDLGEFDRYAFYEHMKTLIAAPPDVLRCDEKHLREHAVFNLCGVVIVTNHLTDGIYLPAEDRRHYVAWSESKPSDFNKKYWSDLWDFYRDGGFAHVAAYLATRDLSNFDPKAPPPKTTAFWSIVDANRAPEDAELADVLDDMRNPDSMTLESLKAHAFGKDIRPWLDDRKNRRAIPHRLEKCGYVTVRNDTADSGLWVIDSVRQVVYAKKALNPCDRLKAARALTGRKQ